MLVHELITLLQAHDPKDHVILSKDSEGNGYSPLSDLSPSLYSPETTWFGEVSPRELTEQMKKDGWIRSDILEGPDVVRAVTLSPIT